MTLVELFKKIFELFHEKRNPIIASLLLCFVTLAMNYYASKNKIYENKKLAATEVMNAFEDAKNNLDIDLEKVLYRRPLSEKDDFNRMLKRASLVKVIMKNKEYLSSELMLDLTKFTRFDDGIDTRLLPKLSKKEIGMIESALLPLQIEINS